MGREVRKVPAKWEHPKSARGHVPLFGGSFNERAAQWDEEAAQWEKGFRRSFARDQWEPKTADMSGTFADWDDERPDEKDYMPHWSDAERTHYQMYETTTEGTPISPVMETPEALAHWLADNNASAFGGEGASYEHWLAMITGHGWAPSAVVIPGVGLVSGVEGMYP